jgi:hypothetical protein
MNVHHLPVYEADTAQVFRPVEISWKGNVNKRQQDQYETD